jgi:type IV pilus assembly protein PilV
MNSQTDFARQQSGMMLIESLLALLIFSLGILALVGLQGMAIKQSTDARYRTEAALLANDIIGQMWVSDRTTALLEANFESPGGAQYTAWATRVGTILPGALPPSVDVFNNLANPLDQNNGRVTVTVNWRAPNEAIAIAPHSHVAIAQIR